MAAAPDLDVRFAQGSEFSKRTFGSYCRVGLHHKFRQFRFRFSSFVQLCGPRENCMPWFVS